MYKYLKKSDGFVWEVTEHDSEGRHKSIYCLGKDPDYIEEEKPKKKTKKEDAE